MGGFADKRFRSRRLHCAVIETTLSLRRFRYDVFRDDVFESTFFKTTFLTSFFFSMTFSFKMTYRAF